LDSNRRQIAKDIKQLDPQQRVMIIENMIAKGWKGYILRKARMRSENLTKPDIQNKIKYLFIVCFGYLIFPFQTKLTINGNYQ
jgi:hypothetical protein